MTEEHQAASDDNIGGRARAALGWQFLSKGIFTGLQMVTGIVLARLLMPADFGIVAMATMVSGLAGVFSDLGLGQALVQRREISREHTTSAFWGTLVMSLMLCGLVILLAPWVGAYFHEPRMVPVLKLMSLTFVLSPFAVVPRSLLQRDLDFRRPFYASLASSVAHGGTGITMALLGYTYWSLVGASLASALVGTVAICILTRYTPPLIPGFRGIPDLYRFGVGATGVGMMNYMAQQVDYFVVGRWLDITALGLYTRAFTLVHAPLGIVGQIVSPILFPVFARLQGERKRAADIMGKVLTIVSALVFPALALFAVAAPELIPLVFGEQWKPSVVPAQIMAAAGALRTLITPSAMLPRGFGAVYSQVWRNGVYAATLFGGAVICSRWGIVGVAWAALFATAVVWALNAQLLYACSGFGLRDYARVLWDPLLITGAVIPVASLTRAFLLARQYDPWLVLGSTILVGLAVALAMLGGPCSRCRAVGCELLNIRGETGGRR